MVEFSEPNEDDEPPPLEELVAPVDEDVNPARIAYSSPSGEFQLYAMFAQADIAYETLSSVSSDVLTDLETTTLPPFEESNADFGHHLVEYICTIGPVVCDDPLYAVAEDRDEGPKIMFKFLRAREESLSQAETRSYSIVLGYYLAQNFK